MRKGSRSIRRIFQPRYQVISLQQTLTRVSQYAVRFGRVCSRLQPRGEVEKFISIVFIFTSSSADRNAACLFHFPRREFVLAGLSSDQFQRKIAAESSRRKFPRRAAIKNLTQFSGGVPGTLAFPSSTGSGVNEATVTTHRRVRFGNNVRQRVCVLMNCSVGIAGTASVQLSSYFGERVWERLRRALLPLTVFARGLLMTSLIRVPGAGEPTRIPLLLEMQFQRPVEAPKFDETNRAGTSRRFPSRDRYDLTKFKLRDSIELPKTPRSSQDLDDRVSIFNRSYFTRQLLGLTKV